MGTPDVGEDIDISGDADVDKALRQADKSIDRTWSRFERDAGPVLSHLQQRRDALAAEIDRLSGLPASASERARLHSLVVEQRNVTRKLRRLGIGRAGTG